MQVSARKHTKLLPLFINYTNMTQIIHTKDLEKAADLGMDEFLQVFTNAYSKILDGHLNAENMHLLNADQHTLLAWHYFSEEMRSGGFVQLIQNGYGGYIFMNPFAKAIKQFGAADLSKLIYKAREIYVANQEALERETTEEEFNALYVDFEIFDDLEEHYFEIEERETALIAGFVDEHIDNFMI